MILQKRNTLVLSLILVSTLAIAMFVGAHKVSSETVATNVCANGATLLINGTVATSIALNSEQIPLLSVNTTSTDAPYVTKVLFYVNDSIPIGRAVKDGSYQWNMPWVVGLAPVDGAQVARVTAKVYFNDSATGTATSCITTQPIYATITGTRTSSLSVSVTPSQWSGPMSYSLGINAETQVQQPSFDPTPHALYEWGTTIGFIQPNGRTAQFSSGTAAGTGTIKVKVMYGGAFKEVTMPVTVQAPEAPLPIPGTNQTTITTPKTSTTPSTTPKTETTILAPVQTVQNPTAQDCIVSAIGVERFTAINTGTSRPTPEELEKFKICFATSNYVVPSNFAPVAPAAIKELPVVKTIKINTLENEKRITDNVEKNVLRFGGKATPNSIVFIYVFSDPLVLTTTTDGEGNWEYVLEDPIEPGNHEVYSVVNKGNGVYERSEVLSFTLSETAEAATVNPGGLTLKLANATPAESQRSLSLYIFGSITVLSLAVAGFVITLLKRNRTATARSTFSAFPADESIQSHSSQSYVAPSTDSQISQIETNTTEANSVGDSLDDTFPKV